MRIIGLTGPIAAGKDAIAKILKRRGAYIIDADRVAHELYVFQSPIWRELVRAFGSKILVRGGKINRQKLGKIVFGDKKKLSVLDKIVHPSLKKEIEKIAESPSTLLGASRKQNAEHRTQTLVVNAAVLAEIGLVDLVDEVWLVTASRAVRLKRLVKAGFSKQEAIKRMNAQSPQKDYLKIADVIIKNDGTLKQLKIKINCLFTA